MAKRDNERAQITTLLLPLLNSPLSLPFPTFFPQRRQHPHPYLRIRIN